MTLRAINDKFIILLSMKDDRECQRAFEESPGSAGQDAGEDPASANSGKVPQRDTAGENR